MIISVSDKGNYVSKVSGNIEEILIISKKMSGFDEKQNGAFWPGLEKLFNAAFIIHEISTEEF